MHDDSRSPSQAAAVSFTAYTTELAERANATQGVRGVVLLGSATEATAARRDEWSDHDFYALFEAGTEHELRRRLSFLPGPDRIVLVAHEGADGFAVLYDDGHLFEFGAGTIEEFGSAKFADHEVLLGDDETLLWTSAAAKRGAAYTPESAADAAGLTLVKLMIGFGRATRGELLSANAFVRGHAVAYLTLTFRRRRNAATHGADPFDPTRRFDSDYPEVAERINRALEAPVMDSARELLSILRNELEPGWTDFPTAAADVVSARLR